MAGLVDQYGFPIKKAELSKSIAGPTLAGVRPVISGHPAEGLTPRRLAHIHREAAEGEPLSYFELAEDIEERDLHYLAVLSTRKRQVSQLPITVKAASEDADHVKHADFVRSWIDDGVLQASLFDMLDAIGKGFSVLELDWRYHAGHLCPRDVTYRPQRWFTFDRDDGETVLLREGVAGEPLVPHKFITHRHRAKSGLTVRGGLARVASWAWMYKSFTMKDWAIFCQNFGAPIRVGKYGRNATNDEKDVLWSAVANIAGDCAAIIPVDMQIEFIEVQSKGDSSELYLKRANWMDQQISKAVLGQTTTTDAISGGHAVSQEHRLVQEDIERADAMMATSTINGQLIPNLVAFNFGPQDLYPKVRIGRPDEVPLGEFSEAFSKMAPLGLTASMSFLRDRLQIPAPKDDDELVGGRAPAPTPISADQVELPPLLDRAAKKPAPAKLLHSRQQRERSDELAERLVVRMESDAAGAMGGLTDAIRQEFMQATDLRDLAERIARLELDPTELADVMGRGLALSHLAGQAALLDDLDART